MTFSATARADASAREISEVEQAAVQLVVNYLSGGPEALLGSLATTSSLKKLPVAHAAAEIEVRLGPPADAAWKLQTVERALTDSTAAFEINFPSGIDELVLMNFVREGSQLRLSELRILAEPIPAAPAMKKAYAELAKTALTAMAIVLMGVATPVARKKKTGRRKSPILLIICIAAIFLAAAAGTWMVAKARRSSAKPIPAVAVAESGGLRVLLPLRRALTRGTGDGSKHLTGVPPAGPIRDVAELWLAQEHLQEMRLPQVEKTLARFPAPTRVPLAEILRGRLNFLLSKEVDTVIAYDRVMELGPVRDGLLLEAAEALMILGFDERAKKLTDQLAEFGSRNALAHYTSAMLLAHDDQQPEAERYLRRAWNLQPVERADLVGTAILWEVLRAPSVSALIRLSSADEPSFAAPNLSTRPISIPPGMMARVSGDFLSIESGLQELEVPGGAALAPAGTPVVNAADFRRNREQRALADLPKLMEAATTAGAFAQPGMRRRIEETATALESHNRWNEILSLTETLSPAAENVPFDVLFMRGNALQKLKRNDDARRLFAAMAVNPTIKRRADPQSMMKLAEMLASVDLFDPAIKLMELAATVREMPFIDDRIRQLSMNQRLARAYSTHETENFVFKYPNDLHPVLPRRAGEILEAELKRLQSIIPVPSFQKVTVNILSWEDFRAIYTGGDHILGFYNGSITLPLAGVPAFFPEVVAVMSHELAHAMIAQATNDQSPRWFHEGLAQRIEMRKYHRNAFNMYDDDKLISLSLLDAVLRGSPDPEMITEGYIESQTVIRFLESEFGDRAVRTMLNAYRDGSTNEDALRKISSLSIADLDNRLRVWGRREAKVFENPAPIRYDGQDEPLARRSKR